MLSTALSFKQKSSAEISDASVGKRTAYVTSSVMMNVSDEILTFGLHPVNTDPADAFFGLAVEHPDDFFDLLFRCHKYFLAKITQNVVFYDVIITC